MHAPVKKSYNYQTIYAKFRTADKYKIVIRLLLSAKNCSGIREKPMFTVTAIDKTNFYFAE